MDDETTLVTPEIGGHFPTIRHWHGDEPLEVGDTGAYLGYSGLTYASGCYGFDEPCQEIVAIDTASWGDYDNSGTYHRSNVRSLLRDFPETFIHATGSYSWEGLFLIVGQKIPEYLEEILEGLKEYPVYDEDDEGKLRLELEQEDWESWGRSDLRCEIIREVASLVEDPSDFDEDERFPDEVLDDLMWASQSDGECHWEPETAVGGYWYGFVDLAKRLAAEWVEETGRQWEDYARTLIPVQPEALFAV